MIPLDEYLFKEGFAFDFFQAVRILARLDPKRRRVGYSSPPKDEIVRFRAHMSLDFPPSSIHEIEKQAPALPMPRMTVNFMGLTGPNGILPRPYTELLIRQQRESKGKEKEALRSWLDLFNHRLISLFVRAWEKYRFYVAYEYGDAYRDDPDTFTQALFSFIGLGMKPLRHRLRYSVWSEVDGLPQEKVLGKIDDLALLYYSGLLAQRPHSATGLQLLLQDYFNLRAEVSQFLGCWLVLEKTSQTQLGVANGEMGISAVVGEKVWDIQSKFRLRIGPLKRNRFDDLLPDRTPIPERKTFFLLVQMVRLYLGPELDFDVQLILKKEDVPACELQEKGLGARLGWNTWLCSQPAIQDASDALFEGVVP